MLAFATVVLAATLPAQTPQYETDYVKLRQEFLERETKLMGAIQNKQHDVIESLLANDFSLTIALDGKPAQVFNYAEWMRTGEQYTLEHFQIQHLGVHMFFPVAIVNYRAMRTDQLGTAMKVSGEYVITDVWIARGKLWELRRRFLSSPVVLTPSE